MQISDIVINLRFPTQGETSGSLLKAMACGKPVILSDINQFREFPDDCVLKAMLGRREQDMVLGHLMRLSSDPDLRQRLGNNARKYVARNCSWRRAAERYAEIITSYSIQ
jgi:glycosyltransferase involved in cell wall biosynthesis